MITRNKRDDSLEYTTESLKELLRRLIALTGGLKDNGKGAVIVAKEVDGSPERTFIPDAEMVARNYKDGIRDPYLSGMVSNDWVEDSAGSDKGRKIKEEEKKYKNETKVDPRQYTVFQKDKVENADLRELSEGLLRYGGSKPKDPTYLRDLVVFNPERMALHWVAILTAMYVKTEEKLPPEGAERISSGAYNEWVDKRDAEYIGKVNEIYYKLLNIDRTHNKEFEKTVAWKGRKGRYEALMEVCDKVHKQVEKAVDAAVEAFPQNAPASAKKGEILSPEERKMLETAFERTTKRTGADKDTPLVKAMVAKWLKAEIYRARANKAVCHLAEEWFVKEVFDPKKNEFEKKEYVATPDRESFVLSGGSATGKSMPMALLCQKLAKGYDDSSNVKWKRKGLNLNDAVHIKSEVMRSLLLEPEFLKYGNRLFFDESAHDERKMIRDEMFKYLGDVLKGSEEVNHKLAPKGAGPIIIHDRRSTYPHETDILLTDGAKLNYYYFNVPAEEALLRNRRRGIEEFKDKDFNPDPAIYAPRFVNARNNIGSQESSARRVMNMPEKFAGKNIVMPLYSTKVEPGSTPQIFGYLDLLHKEIHIRRVTRLIDTVDNAHLAISPELEHYPGPLPVRLTKLTTHTTKKSEQEAANAKYAAEWLVKLTRYNGYHVYISTPPEETRTNQTNIQFAEMHPSPKGDRESPELIKTAPNIYKAIQLKEPHKPGVEDTPSRYKVFLQTLEDVTDKSKTKPSMEAVPPGPDDVRTKSLLFTSSIEYVRSRNSHDPRSKT